MGDLTTHFDKKEFACKCCGEVKVDPEFARALEVMRQVVGPLVILSGYRCAKHNATVGGVSESSHTLGLAADIKCMTSRLRYSILKQIFVERYFNRIGVGNHFIHLDHDSSKPEDVVWMYGEDHIYEDI